MNLESLSIIISVIALFVAIFKNLLFDIFLPSKITMQVNEPKGYLYKVPVNNINDSSEKEISSIQDKFIYFNIKIKNDNRLNPIKNLSVYFVQYDYWDPVNKKWNEVKLPIPFIINLLPNNKYKIKKMTQYVTFNVCYFKVRLKVDVKTNVSQNLTNVLLLLNTGKKDEEFVLNVFTKYRVYYEVHGDNYSQAENKYFIFDLGTKELKMIDLIMFDSIYDKYNIGKSDDSL